MYKTETCPCCDSTDLERFPAVVAPFIAEYVLAAAPARCALYSCKACTFRFFDARFSEEEVGKLYGGYRGAEYFARRHESEPWYSKKTNDAIGHGDQEIASRTRNLEAMLKEQGIWDQVHTVLDYGGDRGQFIPPKLGTRRFVYEISDAVMTESVERLQTRSEVEALNPDFVMFTHVLEHCSDPAAMLEELCRLDAGTYYIEVPFERYDLSMAGRSAAYERYLDFLLRHPLALRAVDFFSTLTRALANRVPPFGVLKCHEHLNFFTEKSLRKLLDKVGLEIIQCRVSKSDSPSVTIPKNLQVLARARTTSKPSRPRTEQALAD